MELRINEGKRSLIKCGSIPLALASLFEILRPKSIDIAIKKPYHLTLRNPIFNICDPGDFKKAGKKNII
tara:strand:+ start:123 stop:329 length:207 start_codon:yes stop_codon:yes gene_type:complete